MLICPAISYHRYETIALLVSLDSTYYSTWYLMLIYKEECRNSEACRKHSQFFLIDEYSVPHLFPNEGLQRNKWIILLPLAAEEFQQFEVLQIPCNSLQNDSLNSEFKFK